MVVNKAGMSVDLSQFVNRTRYNVKLPSFMLSKSEPLMSDEEYKEKAIEMARQHAREGRIYSPDIDSDFNTLRSSYISVASPDRQGIINKAMPKVMSDLKKKAEESDMFQRFMEILFKLETNRTPHMGAEQVLEMPHTPENMGQALHIADFKDGQGNVIAQLTTNGWIAFPTDAETARRKELQAIYNDAWRAAKSEYALERSLEADFSGGLSWLMPNKPMPNITKTDISAIQPQQGQSTKTIANLYEANLHEANQ
ncbi:MAG: hypothetical protein FWG87_06100 [Defluviitaleaceae bacterium]|nr:hypothetical protein [Defluviitaleaceae bacterium]